MVRSGKEKKSDSGKYCKKCGYKYRTRPSGLTYNITVINKGWKVKGDIAWNKNIKGIHFSPDTEFKKGVRISSDTEFKKGDIAWNKDKEWPEMQGENHPNWRGDHVGYGGLHSWVSKHFGPPTECIFCGSRRFVNWANKSGKYKRDLNDWLVLCRKCHIKYDDVIAKGWITRRKRKEK